MMKSFSTVTVGVADLDNTLDLWVSAFGFEVVAVREGLDVGLAELRKIRPGDISRQALVRTPGLSLGMLHFIEFNQPGEPIRKNAQSIDSCPKNLDLYVQDMPRQIEHLKTLGYEFHKDAYTEMTLPDGIQVKEIHMHGHDAINIVLLELSGRAIEFSNQGFSGVGPLVTIVADYKKEKLFYEQSLGLTLCDEIELRGPEIEKMIGLPSGTLLKFGVLGDPSNDHGRIEVISYQGALGNNLYKTITGKSLGVLGVSYQTPDLRSLKELLTNLNVDYKDHGLVETLHSRGETISFESPAGLPIQIHQPS